jgi:hypothetical protein
VLKPEKLRKSKQAIAKEFNMLYPTLNRRIHGKQSIGDFNKTKQKLTPGEERCLIDHILELNNLGFAPLESKIVECANKVIAAWGGEQINPDGKWCWHFLDRHSDKLGTFWSKPLARERAQGLNPKNTKGWYHLIKHQVVNENIQPKNCYGMNETGTTMGIHVKECIVGRKGHKVHHHHGGRDQENVMAIITICTDGTTL